MTCPIVLLSVVCSTERMKIISFVSPIWYSCGFSFLWWKNTIKITQTCPQTNKIAKSIISSAKWIKETRTAFGFYLRGDLKLELFYGSSSIHVTFWKILYQRLIASKFFYLFQKTREMKKSTTNVSINVFVEVCNMNKWICKSKWKCGSGTWSKLTLSKVSSTTSLLSKGSAFQ